MTRSSRTVWNLKKKKRKLYLVQADHSPQAPSHATVHGWSLNKGHDSPCPFHPFFGLISMLWSMFSMPVCLLQIPQSFHFTVQSILQGRVSGCKQAAPILTFGVVMVTFLDCNPVFSLHTVHSLWLLTQSTKHTFCSSGGQTAPPFKWPSGQFLVGVVK